MVGPGLSLVSNYCSSSDESEDDVRPPDETNNGRIQTKPADRARLPLPEQFQFIPKRKLDDHPDDDPESHNGRIRSFPHERGNWVSCIYIPYEENYHFDNLCDTIIDFYLPKIKMKKVDRPHISLTKTFVLLHHWIEQFVGSVRDSLKTISRFRLNFDTVNVYVNEEKTRTFIGLGVGRGANELLASVASLADCCQDFRLDPFYEDPSFHMSVVWCLGDVRHELEETLGTLRLKFVDFVKENQDVSNLNVNRYVCKTGHRTYNLELT